MTFGKAILRTKVPSQCKAHKGEKIDWRAGKRPGAAEEAEPTSSGPSRIEKPHSVSDAASLTPTD